MSDEERVRIVQMTEEEFEVALLRVAGGETPLAVLLEYHANSEEVE